MSKSLATIALGLAVLAAPLAAPALADRGPGPAHGDMAERHMNRMFDALNLTADQRQKLQAIKSRGMEAHKAQREALRTKWEELSALMRSPTATADQALAKQ